MSSFPSIEFESFRQSLTGRVVRKNESSDSDYQQAISRWNEVFTKEPEVVVYVESEDDIVLCIQFVTQYGLDLAVCSGRHALKGTSSSDGVVIDLKEMSNVTVDKLEKTVTAQGGCKAVDLDDAAYKQGMSVVTGVVNDTGMGICLGGGLGWLTGQHGFMVDNILSLRVVLADCTVVNASSEENVELFWACRGAGSSFGVVSEIVFRAYDQGDIFGGFLIYSAGKINQCIDLAATLYDTAVLESSGKLQMMLSFASPPPTHQPVPLFAVFYDGPEPIARSLLAPLYELGPDVDTTSTMPYPAINTLFNSQMEKHKRHGLSSAKLHLPLDKQLLREVWLNYESTIPKYPEAWPSHIVIEIRNLTAGLAKASSEMAFAGRGEWTNILLHPQWDDPRADAKLRQWAVDLAKTINLAEAKRDSDSGQAISYANYSSGDEKSHEIYGANYSRLRQLKQRYDPNSLFNKWYPIVPAETKE